MQSVQDSNLDSFAYKKRDANSAARGRVPKLYTGEIQNSSGSRSGTCPGHRRSGRPCFFEV